MAGSGVWAFIYLLDSLRAQARGCFEKNIYVIIIREREKKILRETLAGVFRTRSVTAALCWVQEGLAPRATVFTCVVSREIEYDQS